MRRGYVIGHWILTLLLAPFTSQAIQLIWGTNPHQVVGLLEVYPISLLFSVAFSLPTFLIYLTCFYFLSKYCVKWTISKATLILISVLGVCVTMAIMKGSMSLDIAIAYSITALIVGLILKIKTNNTTKHNQTITT